MSDWTLYILTSVSSLYISFSADKESLFDNQSILG